MEQDQVFDNQETSAFIHIWIHRQLKLLKYLMIVYKK
jgi:hypothetical protein